MRALTTLLVAAASLFTLACGDIDDHTWSDDAVGEETAELNKENEEMPHELRAGRGGDAIGRDNENEEMPHELRAGAGEAASFARDNENEEMPHDARGGDADDAYNPNRNPVPGSTWWTCDWSCNAGVRVTYVCATSPDTARTNCSYVSPGDDCAMYRKPANTGDDC